MPAPSIQSLLGGGEYGDPRFRTSPYGGTPYAAAAKLPTAEPDHPFSGLMDLPALQERTRATTDNAARDALADINNPFRFMNASMAQQAGLNQWAPFDQALKEAGVSGVRFEGFNPAREAATQAARSAQAFQGMPFNPTAASYAPSVRRLFGDAGAAVLHKGVS